MPSKFVSKSFVRDEIVQAVTTVRSEVIEIIDKSLLEFKETYDVEKNMKILSKLKKEVSEVSRGLNEHSEKLSILVEGGIRSVVLLKKGETWVKSATVRSAVDVVGFIQVAMGETAAWRDRALAATTDLLRSPVRHHPPSAPNADSQVDCITYVGERDKIGRVVVRCHFDKRGRSLVRAERHIVKIPDIQVDIGKAFRW